MLNHSHTRCPAAPTGVRPPGARTLYLAHGERKRASVSDQTLTISNVLAHKLCFPLPRIARIVSSTTVDWSGSALHACQREAITITWIDPVDGAIGTLYPHRLRPDGTGAALDLMLETPEGVQRYRHWQRARRLDILWRGRRRRTPADEDAQDWSTLRRDWVYGGRFVVRLPAALQAQCMALVAYRLAAARLPPVAWGPDAEAIALDHDLCELLWGEMNVFASALPPADGDNSTASLLFERWQQCNAAALLLHIRSLQRLALKGLRPEPLQ